MHTSNNVGLDLDLIKTAIDEVDKLDFEILDLKNQIEQLNRSKNTPIKDILLCLIDLDVPIGDVITVKFSRVKSLVYRHERRYKK